MAREHFEFLCPCCGKPVEVNVRTGRARAVDPKEARGGQDLDSLLDAHQHEGQRLGSVFEEARSDVANADKRLEALFDEAKERARREKDEKPPNPFDLD